MPRTLIVNADDFGWSADINQGIIDAHRHGVVTSTTLIANGPAFPDAVELARQFPGLGVGVHVNLVQGRPLTPASEVPSLVGKGGHFLGSTPPLARRALTGAVDHRQLVTEIQAQIARVVAAGLAPTHVDTHQHAHCLPPIYAALVEAASAFGIHRMRHPREHNLPRLPRRADSRVKSALTGALAGLARRLVDHPATRTPDAFVGPQLMGALDRRALLEVFTQLPDGVTELMCHPGRVSTPGEAIERRQELDALTSRDVLSAAQQLTLATFAVL